jgi:hypothetical protein
MASMPGSNSQSRVRLAAIAPVTRASSRPTMPRSRRASKKKVWSLMRRLLLDQRARQARQLGQAPCDAARRRPSSRCPGAAQSGSRLDEGLGRLAGRLCIGGQWPRSAGRETAPRWPGPAGTRRTAGRCRARTPAPAGPSRTTPGPRRPAPRRRLQLVGHRGAARRAVALACQVDRDPQRLVARQPLPDDVGQASHVAVDRQQRLARRLAGATDQPVCGGSMKTRSKCSNQACGLSTTA